MKLTLTIIFLGLTLSVFATESELISKIKLKPRTSVRSFLRINKADKIYALVTTRKSKRGFRGCAAYRGTMTTKKCRVTSERIVIPNLSLNNADEVIYDNGALNINCGYVKDKWLFGRKIVLNDNCNLVDLEKVIEEDDGSEIKNIKYALTKFTVSE